jgi:hypothetical protein
MTEKIDLAGVLAYNTNLDDMDFRCSNSVAALAVLIGSGACAFFVSAAWAGDRIDFSAPAIPLSVPHPDVEIKEPARMIRSGDFAGGMMDGPEMAAPTQYYVVKSKSREKDDWSLDPRLNDDPDQRDADDLFASRPDSTRATNSNALNMKQASNPNASGSLLQQKYDSGFDGDPSAWRFGSQSGLDGENSRFGSQSGSDRDHAKFGTRNRLDRDYAKFGARNGSDRDYAKFDAQNGSDRDNGRSSDHLGRGFSKADDDSFLTKVFSRDASEADRFNAMRSLPSMSDVKEFNGGAFEERLSNPELGQDSAHTAALPPGYAGFTPLDNGLNRQTGEQPGEGQVSFPAWGPSASPVSPSRSSFNQDQFNASRVVAPNRPVTLSMPQRPGDPH